MRLKLVCLLPEVLKLDGVARPDNDELLFHGLDARLELGEAAVLLTLRELPMLIHNVNNVCVGQLDLILLDFVSHEADLVIR